MLVKFGRTSPLKYLKSSSLVSYALDAKAVERAAIRAADGLRAVGARITRIAVAHAVRAQAVATAIVGARREIRTVISDEARLALADAILAAAAAAPAAVRAAPGGDNVGALRRGRHRQLRLARLARKARRADASAIDTQPMERAVARALVDLLAH